MGRRVRIRGIVPFVMAALVAPLAAAQPLRGRARDLYDRAIDLEHRGDGSAALSLLWEAAGLAPRDGDIQNRLGEALERIGALDAAVDAYRAAAEAEPPPRAAADNLVLALVKAGRSTEAIARARSSLSGAPQDAGRWFTLGLAQADVDVDGAVDSFRHALGIQPRHVLARYNLALALYHADLWQPALAELRAALAVERRPEILYTLGVIEWHLGALDRAAGALGEAVALSPSYADAYVALGSVSKSRGDLKGAIAALHRASALQPQLPAPRILLAQTLALTGDAAGAAREAAEAERLRAAAARSQEAATWTAVGTGRLDAGDAAGAADCFRRATAAFDAFAPAHYQLGRALERLGRHDAARAAFMRARQLNPALVPPSGR